MQRILPTRCAARSTPCSGLVRGLAPRSRWSSSEAASNNKTTTSSESNNQSSSSSTPPPEGKGTASAFSAFSQRLDALRGAPQSVSNAEGYAAGKAPANSRVLPETVKKPGEDLYVNESGYPQRRNISGIESTKNPRGRHTGKHGKNELAPRPRRMDGRDLVAQMTAARQINNLHADIDWDGLDGLIAHPKSGPLVSTAADPEQRPVRNPRQRRDANTVQPGRNSNSRRDGASPRPRRPIGGGVPTDALPFDEFSSSSNATDEQLDGSSFLRPASARRPSGQNRDSQTRNRDSQTRNIRPRTYERVANTTASQVASPEPVDLKPVSSEGLADVGQDFSNARRFRAQTDGGSSYGESYGGRGRPRAATVDLSAGQGQGRGRFGPSRPGQSRPGQTRPGQQRSGRPTRAVQGTFRGGSGRERVRHENHIKSAFPASIFAVSPQSNGLQSIAIQTSGHGRITSHLPDQWQLYMKRARDLPTTSSTDAEQGSARTRLIPASQRASLLKDAKRVVSYNPSMTLNDKVSLAHTLDRIVP